MFPSRLSIERAGADSLYEVTFQVAYARGAPLPLQARLPDRCQPVGRPTTTDSDTVRTRRWTVDCGKKDGKEGLEGARITVDGLSKAGTDVVLSAPFLDTTAILRPEAPSFTLGAAGRDAARTISPRATSVSQYFTIGVEHILLGPDHLLFVLGLLLLVGRTTGRRARKLLETITSFTIGHSITLAMATLGWVAVAGGAVEAIIALSILLLAWEVLQPDSAGRSYAREAPWAFALVCGLLHGFGFAGALAQIGLPDGQIPAALFLFNVGVETGQLAFVAAVAALWWGLRRLPGEWFETVEPALNRATAYGLGGVAAYWVIVRSVPILVP